MTTPTRTSTGQPRLRVAEDAEWVADLLETYQEGDIDVTITILEALLRRLRKASKARRALQQVPPPTLRSALQLRSTGQGDPRCP